MYIFNLNSVGTNTILGTLVCGFGPNYQSFVDEQLIFLVDKDSFSYSCSMIRKQCEDIGIDNYDIISISDSVSNGESVLSELGF